MTPLLGPTGYVFPFAPTAATVMAVGVTRMLEKFHPNVTYSLGAIL
jgi:hypothetical protein